MFCPKCGTKNENNAEKCVNCGESLAASAAVANVVKTASKDALSAFKTFFTNPVGGLADAFSSLGLQRAMHVGIFFGIVFAISLTWSSRVTFNVFKLFLSNKIFIKNDISDTIKVFIWALIPFASLALACAITRIIFRGVGKFGQDVFIAGASLLPLSILFVLIRVLGMRNIEVIMIIAVFAIVTTIMMLFAGCTRLSNVTERTGTLSVPIILIATIWISKILLVSFFV